MVWAYEHNLLLLRSLQLLSNHSVVILLFLLFHVPLTMPDVGVQLQHSSRNMLSPSLIKSVVLPLTDRPYCNPVAS